MSGLFPKTPGFASTELESDQPTLVDNMQSGKRQVRLFGGHKWMLTAKFPIMTRAEFMPIHAFKMRQRGQSESFSVVAPDLAIPQGTIDAGGSMLLDGQEKGAWLASTTAETLTGTDLITNGDFATDATGWTDADTGTGTSVYNATDDDIDLSGTDSSNRGFRYASLGTTVIGKIYVISAECTGYTSGAIHVGVDTDLVPGSGLGATIHTSTGIEAFTFTANSETMYIHLYTSNSGGIGSLDNITCRLASPDLTSNNNGLQVFGSVVKSAVNTGTELMAYSSFSQINFVSQPFNSDLNYSTNDFNYKGWIYPTAANIGYLFDRSDSDGSNRVYMYIDASLALNISGLVSSINLTLNTWHHVAYVRSSATSYIYINGVSAGSVSDSTDLTGDGTAALFFGIKYNMDSNFLRASLALWRTGAYAPTALDIQRTYAIEKQLFDTSASYGIIPKVNGGSQTGYTLTCDGYPNSTLVHKAGDIFSVGTKRKVYMFVEDVTTSSTGTATLTFEPELTESPQDNASVVYYNVPFNMAFKGDIQKYNTSAPLLFSNQIDLMEILE